MLHCARGMGHAECAALDFVKLLREDLLRRHADADHGWGTAQSQELDKGSCMLADALKGVMAADVNIIGGACVWMLP